MGGNLQNKLIPLFHYALNPGGILFLGTSETTGEFNDLFTPLDRKMKLFQRKETFQTTQRASLNHLYPTVMTQKKDFPPTKGKQASFLASQHHVPMREFTEQALLRQIAPAGALINGQGDILYLHGRTGLYLELAPGEAGIINILKMAREGLRHDLTMALQKAAAVMRSSVVQDCG